MTNLKQLTLALQSGDVNEAWDIIERGSRDWEPIERMASDESRKDLRDFFAFQREAREQDDEFRRIILESFDRGAANQPTPDERE